MTLSDVIDMANFGSYIQNYKYLSTIKSLI